MQLLESVFEFTARLFTTYPFTIVVVFPLLSFLPLPFAYAALTAWSDGWPSLLSKLTACLLYISIYPILFAVAIYSPFEDVWQNGLFGGLSVGFVSWLGARMQRTATYRESTQSDHARLTSGTILILATSYFPAALCLWFYSMFHSLIALILPYRVPLLLTWAVIINGVAYKQVSRDKAIASSDLDSDDADRISETSLHRFEMLGGFVGSFLAQHIRRHKIRKFPYQYVFWNIVVFHALFWGAFYIWYNELNAEFVHGIRKLLP